MYVFCAFHLHSGSKGIIPESLSLLCLTVRNFTLKIMGINPLSANFTKWSNTLKQFVGKYPTNCLSVFDRFVGLALKGLSLHIGDTFGGISVPN